MIQGHFKVFSIIVFILTAGVIGALVFVPGDLFLAKSQETQRTRVVIPQSIGTGGAEILQTIRGDELQALKIELEEGEAAVAVLTRDFDNDYFEDQLIAYRIIQDIDSPIFITYIEYNEDLGQYHRLWSAPTAASRPGTLILYTEDLIGDDGICVLVSGMNNVEEQTLTAFRKIASRIEPFIKIAEFRIEGTIAVEDPDNRRRSPGRSLTIATYGRDYSSVNIMDQIEVSYTFNPFNGLYEQSNVVRIPGAQIEQRRVGELLNGQPEHFEEFIRGLWHQGAENERRYVYFNTSSRELVFYNNNTQEMFVWQNSSPTRYGIHINSRNVSLTSVRRTVNVELVSLESIRIRIFQDAYLRTAPITIWDGVYRRLPPPQTVIHSRNNISYFNGNFIEESFNSQDALLAFQLDGTFSLDPLSGPSELSRKGLYVLYSMDENQLLELRTIETGNGGNNGQSRETYIINLLGDTLILTRVQIGIRGIQELHEAPIVLQRNS